MGAKNGKPRRGHARASVGFSVDDNGSEPTLVHRPGKDALAALRRSPAHAHEPALRERLAHAIASLEGRRS